MNHYLKALLMLIFDGIVAGVAFWVALLLRYDGNIPAEASTLPLYGISYGLICMVVFYLFGLHRSMWRYTSTHELMKLSYAVLITMGGTGFLIFLLTRLEFFPRSAFVILPLLHVAVAAAPRIFMRTLHDNPLNNSQAQKVKNVLLVGVNDAADLFIREVNRQTVKSFNVVALLDNDPTMKNRLVHNIPVRGALINLPQVAEWAAKRKVAIDTVIITSDSKSELHKTALREFIQTAKNLGLEVKRLPSMSALEEGEKLTNLKPVLVEDLLGRDTVNLDMTAIKNLVENKCVLITGAGGSIGSEICRQTAMRKPEMVILADQSELALYEIDLEFAKNYPHIKRKVVLLDVKNSHDVDEILRQFQVDIIFHAAAYKHVPMVEANPIAGIENNLFGTVTMADSAIKNNVAKMVIISTDKAVNPTNVMGATKRAAEIYCQQSVGNDTQDSNVYTDKNQNKTQILTVRFGNVLGSTGSVVPLFTRQIREGGPVTVTHKDATRYFMTIPEAVQITMQAATLGQGGEVFMLDMGEPVKIWTLAEEMIRLSGLTPYEDIDIKEIGLRPGEKMFEELWYDEESMNRTADDKIFLVKPVQISPEELQNKMAKIIKNCEAQDSYKSVAALRELVTEYKPAGNSPFADKPSNIKAK